MADVKASEPEDWRPKCHANVYDRYAQQGRSCMRRQVEGSSYCWQHARIARGCARGAARAGVK